MNSNRNNNENNPIRCFIAIVLDGPTKGKLRWVQNDIRATGVHAGWPSAQNFHLTLKFLGNISEQTLPCIKTMLSETITDKTCFDITFNRLGVFPNVRHPKVIWIGPDKTSSKLITLQRDIDLKLDRCHQFIKEKKFSPHITLSRISHRANLSVFKKALEIKTGTIKIPVNQVHLIKSCLSPSGAVHSTLFRANLKPS
ncbi:RNA 2',3'-cyclic phosphodiesterase [Desulfobacter curvatus]|uniref:RNA 2',3'-cyclic phosphodiesterase n=1 Tax=Desulfobacter curvatus TaxID=2290 RepID=UPI00037A2DA6|nr:RNA 2',3'-cyclic phosphodiesterase [Desulfobacter curvatus]